MKRQQTKEGKAQKQKKQEQEQFEILRLYTNGRSLDGLGELSVRQQLLIADLAQFWLIKHGIRTIKIQKQGHYGWYAALGIIGGFIFMLVLLYYLPI